MGAYRHPLFATDEHVYQLATYIMLYKHTTYCIYYKLLIIYTYYKVYEHVCLYEHINMYVDFVGRVMDKGTDMAYVFY